MDEHTADFERYTRSRRPMLLRIARNKCRDHELAEDIVQDTLTKLFLVWNSVRDPSALDAFTVKTLHRLVIDDARLTARRPRIVSSAMPDVAAVPTPIEDALDLREALLMLTPRQRAIVMLRYVDDVAVKDVALAMDCGLGSVKSQSSRALAHLRKALRLQEECAGA